jgi:hypothetical protein
LGGGGGGASGGGAALSKVSGAGGSGALIVKYPNTFTDLTVGTGLVIDDGLGGDTNGADAPLSPSFTPAGFKVYLFKAGQGTVTF